MRRIVAQSLIVIASLTALQWAAPAARAQTAAELVKQAHAASLSAKTAADFTNVIDMCDKILAANPTEGNVKYSNSLKAWALDRRGEQRSLAGDEQGALTDFEASLALDRASLSAKYNRGVSHATLGNTDQALADFDDVVGRNPNHAKAWFNRAEVLFLGNRVDEALTSYTEALRRRPNEPNYLISRAYAYFQRGSYREALADLNAALRTAPNNAQGLTYRGDVYLGLGRYQEAANDYRKAISVDPKMAQAYAGAAWLMATCPDARLRNPDLAMQAGQKAIEIDGETNFRDHDALAAAYASGGKFEQAIASQKQAIELAKSQKPTAMEGLQFRLALYEKNQPYRDGMMSQR